MAAECCSSCEYQRTVGYPSTSWASCFVKPGVKINSAYYRDVLLTQKLLQVIGHISGNEFVFQQDSAPALRAHETIKLSSYAERRDTLYFTGTVATEQSRS